MSNRRMITPSQTSNTMTESYDMYFQEYIMMSEYCKLKYQSIPGVYVMPSASSPFTWNGLIFVKEGLYQNGVFRFTMNIPHTYPNIDCPQLIFDFPVYHPLVHPVTGDLDVQRGFPNWRRNVNYLWQVIMYVRRIFFKIDTINPWNKEAASLYESDLDAFKRKVEETVNYSKEQIKKPPACSDLYAIRFSPLSKESIEETRRQMKEINGDIEDIESIQGLSWM